MRPPLTSPYPRDSQTRKLRARAFTANDITTSHYTAYNFVPKNLWQQFQRVANVYFLLIGMLQLDVFFPGLSPTHWSTTIAPLAFVLSINAAKEAYDDYFRHRSDAAVNATPCVRILRPKNPPRGGGAPTTTLETVRWKDLRVGDLALVRNNQELPADVVCVQSSDRAGVGFVETANLDGETNLKAKRACAIPGVASGRGSDPDAVILEKALQGAVIQCEAPNNQLYKFEGKWVGLGADGGADGGADLGVSVDNVLLRGSTLRNTDWIAGVVVFTGGDTKLMRNSVRSPRKVSSLERQMNALVLCIGAFQLGVSLLCAALQRRWFLNEQTSEVRHWYLMPSGVWPDVDGAGATDYLTQLVRFLVLLNALIPISLYVTLELVKVMQCGWIGLDRSMYDPVNDVKCGVRTTALNEELGQVGCVLSDKTGTLTQNVMAFVKCSVGGRVYSADDARAERAARTLPSTPTQSSAKSSKKSFADPDGFADLSLDDFDDDDDAERGRHRPHARDVHTIARSVALRAAAGARDPAILAFLRHLAACHTVVPAADDSSLDGSSSALDGSSSDDRGSGAVFGGLRYQASSPDEEALVTGAALLGRRLLSNAAGAVVTESHPPDGSTDDLRTGACGSPGGDFAGVVTERCEVLAVNEFTSARKRMSVVIRDVATGTCVLLLKGADNAVLERLAPPADETAAKNVDAAKAHLDDFAREGLRTLVLAQRVVPPDELGVWLDAYHAAQAALVDREGALADVAELIERDCALVGATAVEDKLQDGVPETIETLRRAGCLVWMLTGDKLETAVSIANTCRLIDAEGELAIVQESDFVGDATTGNGANPRFLRDKAREAMEDAARGCTFGLVIEGGALQHALATDESQSHFLALCRASSGVVCCRVSPIQKARVTTLMKRRGGFVTAGVGDGANDVGMIKAAHIGVGISGREGRAAVLASDYSVGQFRFLANLLLVHGRWSAKRNREVVLYAFYKNYVYAMANVWFGCVSAMSAQPVFTTAAIATFNVLWTSLPTVAFACFDQDVSPATSLAHPELYRETSKYSNARFLLDALAWLVSASWHSLWCLFACLAVLGDPEASTADGKQWDLFAVGIAVFTAAVVACDAKVAIRTNHWTAFNALAVIGSVCAWFPFVELVSDAYVSFGVFASVSGVAEALFPEPRFWLAIVLAVVGAVVPDAVAEVYLRLVAPKDWHILREACDEEAAKKAKKARDRAKAVKKARGGSGPLLPVVVDVSLRESVDDEGAKPTKGSGGASPPRPARTSCTSCVCAEDEWRARRDRRKSRNPSYLEALAAARAAAEVEPDWEVTNAELSDEELV